MERIKEIINLILKYFKKSIPFLGGLYRIIFILLIIYSGIEYIFIGNILDIPISEFTLKNIYYLILFSFLIIFGIYKLLLDDYSNINYEGWFSIGFLTIIILILFY